MSAAFSSAWFIIKEAQDPWTINPFARRNQQPMQQPMQQPAMQPAMQQPMQQPAQGGQPSTGAIGGGSPPPATPQSCPTCGK